MVDLIPGYVKLTLTNVENTLQTHFGNSLKCAYMHVC